jgi:hypothetical protein
LRAYGTSLSIGHSSTSFRIEFRHTPVRVAS